MFNLLHMDIRRLFRTRSFYVIMGVTAALIFLVILLVATMADPNTLDAMEADGMEIGETDRQMSEEIRHMTQLEFVDECVGSGSLLIMAGIGMTLFVQADFSSGFIKNICFARPRRREYVLSKLLAAGVYSGLILLAGVLVSLIAPLFFGLRPAASPVLELLQYVFWCWLTCWAFSLMALALVTLTRSSVLGIALAVLAGGGVTAQLVTMLCRAMRLPDLGAYLVSTVARTQCVPAPDAGQITMISACILGWGLLYTTASLLSIEKRDI